MLADILTAVGRRYRVDHGLISHEIRGDSNIHRIAVQLKAGIQQSDRKLGYPHLVAGLREAGFTVRSPKVGAFFEVSKRSVSPVAIDVDHQGSATSLRLWRIDRHSKPTLLEAKELTRIGAKLRELSA